MNLHTVPQLSVLVLAGGDASRLGGQKAERPFAGGRLVDTVLAVAQSVSTDVLLLSRDRTLPAERTRRIPDEPGLRGPLAGLAAGLRAARHEWSLLLPCDQPFAQESVIERLRQAAANEPWARCIAFQTRALQTGPMVQPFHALYHRELLDQVLETGVSQRPSLRSLLEQVDGSGRLCQVRTDTLGDHADERFLHDVNTPAEYEKLHRVAGPQDISIP